MCAWRARRRAWRRHEWRQEAKGAAERKAATKALQAARAAAEQVRPSVGAEATGAVQVRRAEERCKEAERVIQLGDADWPLSIILLIWPFILIGIFLQG